MLLEPQERRRTPNGVLSGRIYTAYGSRSAYRTRLRLLRDPIMSMDPIMSTAKRVVKSNKKMARALTARKGLVISSSLIEVVRRERAKITGMKSNGLNSTVEEYPRW